MKTVAKSIFWFTFIIMLLVMSKGFMRGFLGGTETIRTDRYIKKVFEPLKDIRDRSKQFSQSVSDPDHRNIAFRNLQSSIDELVLQVSGLSQDKIHSEAIGLGSAMIDFLEKQKEVNSIVMRGAENNDLGLFVVAQSVSNKSLAAFIERAEQVQVKMKQKHNYSSKLLDDFVYSARQLNP